MRTYAVVFLVSALTVTYLVAFKPSQSSRVPVTIQVESLKAQLASQRQVAEQIGSELSLHRTALEEAESRAAKSENELAAIEQQLTKGYVEDKRVVITESNVAYPLIQPKLMVSVQSLSGGTVIATFADQRKVFYVGQYVELQIEACQCYLLLESSARGKAVFRFGCKEENA